MNNSYYLRILLSTLLALSPLHSYSDAMMDYAQQGKKEGRSLLDAFNQHTPSLNNGTLNMPYSNQSININELYPGMNQPLDPSEYFPDGVQPDINKLKSISKQGKAIEDYGESYKAKLWNDSISDEPSAAGAAYGVLLKSHSQSRPINQHDRAVSNSKEILNSANDVLDTFSDCGQSTKYSNGQNTKHLPDYKQCIRHLPSKWSCNVVHLLGLSANEFNIYMASTGRNYFTIAFDLTRGTWQAAEPSDGVTSSFTAIIPTLNADKICKANTIIDYTGSWDWPESQVEGRQDSTASYTVLETPSCSNGLKGKLQINDDTTSSDIAFKLSGRFQFTVFDHKADSWQPQACIDKAIAIKNGRCQGDLVITQGAKDHTQCIAVNGRDICPSDIFFSTLKPSPIPGIPTLATKIAITNHNCGNTPHSGSCEHYDERTDCEFISSTCYDNNQVGECSSLEETWDCGHDISDPTIKATPTLDCPGPVRCMGEECVDAERTESTSFTDVAALLDAARFMSLDMNCSDSAGSEGGDQNVDTGCDVFGGAPYECKIAVGGMQDCCDVPTNTSAGTYIHALLSISKMDSSLMALDNGAATKGAYQLLRKPIAATMTEVTQPFASYIENISGTYKQFTKPIDIFVDELEKKIKDTIANTINDMLGEVASDMGVDAAMSTGVGGGAQKMGEDAGAAIVNNASAAMSHLMAAYTAYVVAVMVVQMLYECEEDEFALAAKKETKSCHYIGKYCSQKVKKICVEKRRAYCCYNSPLSRIIGENVRPQIGRGFGSPKYPDCGGLSIEELAQLDWSQIDLSEWTSLLYQHNLMTIPDTINLESMTGKGNILSEFNGPMDPRKSSDLRALERLEGIDVDAKRKEAYQATSADPL
ncbi:MAG: conjugal transfer mating pair stabilization protein TraN [Candidatus Thiodiazotropha endolucinida]|nr:conjugal transfer mating pair stabilization protein TraN [Candidatus Thiodiazotropha taylori]MCW4301335.1 conjugal transfer mating pair stabilization protein TraN [Candidatus Thiodiazotropha endolucinida]